MSSIWGRFRRGQVRGIDFSLAMIIFVLTMSQVLVLTNTFIQNSQSSQDISSQIQENQNYANQILSNPGLYMGATESINWYEETTSTLTTDGWNFGLSDGNGSIEPLKLGRLANNSHTAYNLTYAEITEASTLNGDFGIKITSTIDIEFLSLITSGSDIQVIGQVTKEFQPLNDASVQLLSFDSSNGFTSQLTVLTNSTGHFDQTLISNVGGGSDFQFVIGIVTYGAGHQDVTYGFHDGQPTTFAGQTLRSGSSSSGLTLDVYSEAGATIDYYAVYSGYGSNFTENLGQGTSATIAVPVNGLSLIFSISGSNIAISTFPLIADDVLHNSRVSTDPQGTQMTTTNQLIYVRGVLLKFIFSTWS